jgi:hypothetical protein
MADDRRGFKQIARFQGATARAAAAMACQIEPAKERSA